MNNRTTMSDIAVRAGVSKSTVSHVLNGTRFVEEETRQRVLQIINEMNYRPSHLARSLVSKRTNTVGLLISDVANPFYHQVIRGVEEIAFKHNYNVYLFNANYDLDRSLKYVNSMIDRQADGTLIMTSRLTAELVRELVAHQANVVVLDWDEAQLDGVGSLSIDFETGIRQAVQHLIELGHTRFAHVSGSPGLWTAQLRQSLYLQALAEAGIHPDNVAIVEGNFRLEGGREALQSLMSLPQMPTAVFAGNDLTAIGLLWEAHRQGLRVPEDISIIGVDDIPMASELTPALTTVALPSYQIGVLAMTMLLEIFESAQGGAPIDSARWHQVMPTQLVIRATTGIVA